LTRSSKWSLKRLFNAPLIRSSNADIATRLSDGIVRFRFEYSWMRYDMQFSVRFGPERRSRSGKFGSSVKNLSVMELEQRGSLGTPQ
jgi:hypothetical protein